MRQTLPFWLAVLAFGALSCATSDEPSNTGGGGAGSAGFAGKAGNGAALAGRGGAGAGGSQGGAAATAGAGAAGGGNTNGGASPAGSGGAAGATGGAGATSAGAAATAGGGSAGSSSAGSSNGGGGRDAGGGEAGAEAGAAGAPDEAGCESPFETLDISRLSTTETLEEYAVSGDTAAEIRQSINETRGRDYDAYTSWYLSWQFADCDGGGLVITADVVYSMPAWEPPAGVEPSLVGSWDAYMSALFCHEYGHARIGLEAANAAYGALAEIEAGGDCGAQQSQASAAFTLVLDDYRARELEYDETTNHGATMGAVFPP